MGFFEWLGISPRDAPTLPGVTDNVRDSGQTFMFGRADSGERVDEKSAMQIATVYGELKPYTKENYHYHKRIFCEKCGWPLYRNRRSDGKIQFICAGRHSFHVSFCSGIIIPEEVLDRLPEKDGYYLLKEEIIDGEKHYSYSCRSKKPERKKKPAGNKED